MNGEAGGDLGDDRWECHGSARGRYQRLDHSGRPGAPAFYWQLTLLATLGGFLFGYDTSNIGSALNFVPYNLHGLALGYLVSGASLGAAAGAILAGAASVIERVEKGAGRRAWTPGVRRALIVVSIFFIFQQITGINVPLYYGPHLLGPIFSGAHANLVQTTVAGVEVTSIMTAVNVASTYLGFRWIDSFGRRKLAMGGYTGMIVFALIAALGLAATSGTLRLVVIMIGLDGFIASFAIGVGGTGWTLQGEVFPTAVRGQAAAFCAMIDWLANFLLIEVFPVWQNAISLGGVLVCFAALAALAIVFVWKFLPETKSLPVEEIVRLFDKQAA